MSLNADGMALITLFLIKKSDLCLKTACLPRLICPKIRINIYINASDAQAKSYSDVIKVDQINITLSENPYSFCICSYILQVNANNQTEVT